MVSSEEKPYETPSGIRAIHTEKHTVQIIYEFLCQSASPVTNTPALTHWFNPWRSRINQKVGVDVSGGCLGSCHSVPITVVSAHTHQYVTIRTRNLFLSLHSNTSLSLQPHLLPCCEDTGQQMKSSHLCTVHYRSLAKNETWALQLLFLLLWAAVRCSLCGRLPLILHSRN